MPREAEVHDPHLPGAGDHDVFALEVAVDQLGGVGGRQPAAGGHEDLEDLPPRPGGGVQPVGDGVTVDELHGDEDLVLEAADVVHDDHVGVRQAGDRLRFAQQAGLLFSQLGGRRGR